MLRKSLVVCVLLLGVALVPRQASATPYLIGGTLYAESGPTESVIASFLAADGGISLGSYKGLVKLVVSGVGESLGTSLNDGFYVYTNAAHTPIAPFHDPNYYQLAFDSTTLVPNNPVRDATRFIVYDIDANTAVTPVYVPGYRGDHTYSIIVNTGLVSLSQLHFGTSNGVFGDNSGAHNIQVTQLDAVPEPASMILLGTGLALVARRRLSRKNA